VYLNWQQSRTTTDIVASLLKQVLERNTSLPSEIKDLYHQCQEQRETQLCSRDLSRLLNIEARQISSFFIIVDALDECTGGETSCARLLLELGNIPNVRLMITGRKGVEHVVFSKCKDSATLEIRASDEDIRKSIDSQLNTTVGVVSDAMQNDPTLRSSILDTIVTKASGMYAPLFDDFADDTRFLLVSLYLKFLERQRNKHLIRPALDRLSTDLIETYDAAIARISSEADQRDVEIAFKALMWITFAREPLQAETLLHALAASEGKKEFKESDFEDIQRVVSLCVGLASIDQKGGEIRLVHETTKQHLQRYFRDERNEDGNAEIAKVCLRYFSSSTFSIAFEDKRSLEDHLRQYKLSSYASTYWFVHIREGSIERRFIPVILDTFENQGTRDSVFQIAEYVKDPLWFHGYGPLEINLLHLASMHGLCILCGEVLRQSGKIQKL
jgi:hypothetical protein